MVTYTEVNNVYTTAIFILENRIFLHLILRLLTQIQNLLVFKTIKH